MEVYQHYREHEHPFIDRVFSWIESVKESYTVYVTDFLDPREQQIVSSLIGKDNEEVVFEFFGGTIGAERKRAVIAPYFVEVMEADFEIVALEARYPTKFIEINHRDVLGTISSLGIDRKKIGDLIVLNGKFQIVTTEQLAEFMKLDLTKVKNSHIKLKQIPFSEIEEPQQAWDEQTFTVSSLRLDVILKEIYKLSRNNAAKLIESERVKVNHLIINQLHVQLIEGDLISARGFGRCKIVSIGGKTKKGKIKLNVAFLLG